MGKSMQSRARRPGFAREVGGVIWSASYRLAFFGTLLSAVLALTAASLGDSHASPPAAGEKGALFVRAGTETVGEAKLAGSAAGRTITPGENRHVLALSVKTLRPADVTEGELILLDADGQKYECLAIWTPMSSAWIPLAEKLKTINTNILFKFYCENQQVKLEMVGGDEIGLDREKFAWDKGMEFRFLFEVPEGARGLKLRFKGETQFPVILKTP